MKKKFSEHLTGVVIALAVLISVFGGVAAQTAAAPSCARTITANVVALDQVFFWNRLGACQPQGQIFALARDVFPDGADESSLANSCANAVCTPGQVHLRETKRPRPIVLRMNVDDCLQINLTNLINPNRGLVKQCPECLKEPGVVANADEQVATRDVSIQVNGLQLVKSIADDGSNVGKNASSLIAPGDSGTYTLTAERVGQHVLHTGAAMTGGEGNGGQLNAGLFGAVNVEPRGATWMRSQVTARDLVLGSKGTTADGHPIIDYGAVYPVGHPRRGEPIFKMLRGHEIVHTDLTAIIAGPFAEPAPRNPVYPHRNRSFREFTIIYHDEIGAVQAFPGFFEDPVLSHTTASVRDGFAINYGTGGIGSEIIANRLAVGPMRDCIGCKYEEFFLSSWVIGDPAQIVDIPANACVGDPTCRATEAFYPDDPSNVYHGYLRDHVTFRILHGGSKEHHIHHQHTHQWLFAPDSDESAYLDSQAIGPGASFTLEMVYNGSGNRNAAVGDSIFHCHFYPHFAQGMWSLWRVHDVFEDGTRKLPDGEIVQGTPIPALVPIPKIAMAPVPGALVTIAADPLVPNKGGQVQINGKFVHDMTSADLVGLGNPGYPFFVPGVGGARAPHPPLDTIDTGGLPRHVLLDGEALHVETRLDFTKELENVEAEELRESGEPVEEVAMRFHEQRFHDSFFPNGTPADGPRGFIANGLPRQPGAPFAEPCMLEDAGRNAIIPPNLKDRIYKAADIQLDAIFNKSGWHFSQQRMLSLWGDVQDTFDGVRAPEPFFFRANTNDCISYFLTNLVPNIYELDDFQVRTPTDVLGQHIHLVKFDVTASDGAANGWNYEDGSFSPDEVRERIRAIRRHNLCVGDEIAGGDTRDDTFACPVAQPHPFFGAGPNNTFVGAQTTVQRWFADDVLNLAGVDRTLRTVFTHDHFGPSTHQQAGLYAGLLVEPEDSVWRDPETGEIFGVGGIGREVTGPGGLTTNDGGPTSWRADILAGTNGADSYREFMFELADFSLAYSVDTHNGLQMANGLTLVEGQGPTYPLPYGPADFAKGGRAPGEGFDVPEFAINPPGAAEIGLPFLTQRPFFEGAIDGCPGGVQPPCPEAVSAADVGTMVANYRNEPIPLRVRNPDPQAAAECQVPANFLDPSGCQAAGLAGDLSHVFRSDVTRADALLNTRPFQWPYNSLGHIQNENTGARAGDPFTPLMRAYEMDKIQIRLMVGAHEEGHNVSVNGMKWLFEPSWGNSGWRNSQMMGISEHFEFLVPADVIRGGKPFADFAYKMGSSVDDLWNGNWGLLRIHSAAETDDKRPLPNLLPLPTNVDARAPVFANPERFRGACPVSAPIRAFRVDAVRAQDVLGPNGLEYNSRQVNGGPLKDPTAILYVRHSDLKLVGGQLVGLKNGVPVEPLVLRANAGDCIELTLGNLMPVGQKALDLDGFNGFPNIVDFFNANQVLPSAEVGLHAQLVHYDILKSEGNNVGFNLLLPSTGPGSQLRKSQTVPPGQIGGKYQWYAGDVTVCESNGPIKACQGLAQGARVATPIEFGAINLMSSDPVKHSNKGAVGALIIEPAGATWVEDPKKRAAATVDPDGDPFTPDSFRELVLIFQDDINMRFGSDTTLPTALDPEGNVVGSASFAAGEAIPNLADAEDAEDSGQKAFNYSSEPMWFRGGWAPNAPLGFTRNQVISNILSNTQVGGDPETPILTARKGQAVRFRILEPGGKQRNHVFVVNGHVRQREPYVCPGSNHNGVPGQCAPGEVGSQAIGDNPLSLWEGARMGHGPTNHFDAVLQNGAGGKFGVTGDFLYRDFVSFMLDGGLWGILRVVP